MTSIFDKGPTLGSILLEYRKRKGISQNDLAGRLNVTIGTVVRWEDDNGTPSIKSLNRLSDETGLSFSELFRITRR